MKLCILMSAAALMAFANPANAGWSGSGKPMTAAKQAEYECAAMYYGSGKSIAASIIGGGISYAVGRAMFIEKCMKERASYRHAPRKPPQVRHR